MGRDSQGTKPIGWGIIGIGEHVEKRMAPALNVAANTNIVAVCSRSIERAKIFADKHGIELAYDSLEKMLNNPEIDALYVATPNNLHSEQTIQAAEAGKHVMCEKPMALTEADCKGMIEACKKNNVKLGLVFQNRYHPVHVEARRLIKVGEIGEILTVKAQYCSSFLKVVLQRGWRNDPNVAGAGALVATGLHPIDLLRFLLDSEIVEVRALCEPQIPRNAIDEMVYVILKFANGVCGTVISGAVTPRSDNDAVLYGSKAKITCKDTIGMQLKGELLVEGDSIDMRMTFNTENPMLDMYVPMVEAFNGSINRGIEPDISGYDGLQMFRIAEAIIKSSREGKAIKVLNAKKP